MSRLPYLHRDELDPDGQQVWDSVVGLRGDMLVKRLIRLIGVALNVDLGEVRPASGVQGRTFCARSAGSRDREVGPGP